MANSNVHVGVVGTGIYIPSTYMSAKEVSEATKGVWSEEAVISKLGFKQKPIAGPDDGTQEMGVRAALDCLKNTGVDPKEIDLIVCIGEEWKEYPLTTSALYIQDKIGAVNAWGIDVQLRCCTCVAAMELAKSYMLTHDDCNCAMIVGGYRNGDYVDYTDKAMSMMYNLGAGGGALIMKKNYGKNAVLGSKFMSDGSLSRDVGVVYGGTLNPINKDNLDVAYKSLKVMNEKHMKDRLNEVSMPNWIHCIEESLKQSGISKEEFAKNGYLAVLHFKYSMHKYMLELLGLTEDQSVYLGDYGHIGQIDQILSLHLALQQGKVKDGSIISMIAAGIGYAWAANIIKWGPVA